MYERAISIAEEMIARLEDGATKEAFESVADLSIDFCEAIPASIKQGHIPLLLFENKRKRVHESHADALAELHQTNRTRSFIADQEKHLQDKVSSSFDYAYCDPFRIGSHCESGSLWVFEYVGTEVHTGTDGLPHEWKVTEQRFSPTEKDKVKFIGILNQWVRHLESLHSPPSTPNTKAKSKAGRKPIKKMTALERRIKTAWDTKSYTSYRDCDKALNKIPGTTKSTIAKLTKREKRKLKRTK